MTANTATSLRAFFAVELGEAARRAAASCIDRLRAGAHGDGLRFVRPEGLHVTLRFLGSILPEQVAPLAAAVGPRAAVAAPFSLSFGALQLFPSERRPRVVALHVEPAAPLEALARTVEEGVVEAGFHAEPRGFRAHVTLARVREGARASIEGVPAPGPSPFEVREVVLFESRPGPGGSIYAPLARLPLGGAAAGDRPASPDGDASIHPQPGFTKEN